MPLHSRHFSVAEANALLPLLRAQLAELQQLDEALHASHEAHRELFAKRVNDVGGPALAAHYALWVRWRRAALRIVAHGVELKDIRRGLIDFPHVLPESGEEVYLCWEACEGEVAHWHGLQEGFTGRRPLPRRGREPR
ncbi:MAG: DUF2203 domain-containing protein [Phycisphaerales bacterium]|nr:DUF2203 domain-containing protein [Phycisphaerales bacterium]